MMGKEKEKVMKKFLKIFIIILGGLVIMTNLFGCDKNSRAHVESQFVDLEKIYSTANFIQKDLKLFIQFQILTRLGKMFNIL